MRPCTGGNDVKMCIEVLVTSRVKYVRYANIY